MGTRIAESFTKALRGSGVPYHRLRDICPDYRAVSAMNANPGQPSQGFAGIARCLHMALDLLNLGILLVDHDDVVTFANRAGRELVRGRRSQRPGCKRLAKPR